MAGLLTHACMLFHAETTRPARSVQADATAAEERAPPPEAPIDRRRPGIHDDKTVAADNEALQNPGAVRAPLPEAFPVDHLPIPDRWRLASNLGIRDNPRDPYNQNHLKGDRPIAGTEDCFLALTGISDTIIEPRSFPTPVGNQTTQRPGSLDTFGRANSFVFAQTFLLGGSLFRGSTAFKPPEYEFRVILGANINYASVAERRILSVKPTDGPDRLDGFVGLQEFFLDYHIRNVSDRYDFDSVRVGIQPFSTDFRGFLFQDNQLGIRLFGNRDNNRWQYNLAAFFRLEKDTNSGLNDISQTPRDDQVFVASLYRQDLPVPGLTSQITLVYNRSHDRGLHIDSNGFPVRPALIGTDRTRAYDIVYPGLNMDGHIGRVNLTTSFYGALGQDRNSIFTNRPAFVRAFFAAAEPSIDFDWVRVRASALYASGDSNPYDNVETGFDAIVENPLFAGADTSYYIRQSIPFAGGGRAVSLNGRNGILNDLRSSKDEGQSNFNNPGTILTGIGADFDITPQVRVSANANHLWFATTAIIQALRQQGNISTDEGWDTSIATIWRPKFTQNIIVRTSFAVFTPGRGFGQLFTNRDRDDNYYSGLFNVTFNY